MNLKDLNELLKDVRNVSVSKNLTEVKNDQPSDYYVEVQGKQSQRTVTYKIKDEEDVMIQVIFEIDSYGEYEQLISIQFVKSENVVLNTFS